MEFKRVKLLSGMLSAAALASVAGVPVMAGEVQGECLSLTNTLENSQEAESEQSGSVEEFIGVSSDQNESADQNESGQTEDLFTLTDQTVVTEDLADLSIPFTEEAAQAAAEEEARKEEAYTAAAQEYNNSVLPELQVALDNGNVMTGVLGEHLDADPKVKAEKDVSKKPAALEEDKKIVVASPNVYLNIHSEPTLGSDVLGKMYSNDMAIELRKEDERWTNIRSGNIVGYVMNDYLVNGNEAKALSEIVSTQVATVDKNSDKEIFQEASGTAKIIAEAKEGDQYEVTESGDGWLGILTENGEGFIPSSEVTLSMACPVAESTREEADRISNSNVKERADYEQRRAEKADAVAELARTRAKVASGQDEETATSVVEVALRAADAAAAQADVAKVAVSQAGAESGQAVIDFALQYVGNPYVWGGSSLTHGADCSGFVMAVYGNFGFRLPHYDVSDRSVGSPVSSLSEARAGDIVCYNGHVALYMGDGKIVHAQDERHGITTSSATFMHIVCIRRLFN